jgi:hypothetical protein
MNDENLIQLAIEEISRVGLIKNSRFRKGWVVRGLDSYPTYYLGYL